MGLGLFAYLGYSELGPEVPGGIPQGELLSWESLQVDGGSEFSGEFAGSSGSKA